MGFPSFHVHLLGVSGRIHFLSFSLVLQSSRSVPLGRKYLPEAWGHEFVSGLAWEGRECISSLKRKRLESTVMHMSWCNEARVSLETVKLVQVQQHRQPLTQVIVLQLPTTTIAKNCVTHSLFILGSASLSTDLSSPVFQHAVFLRAAYPNRNYHGAGFQKSRAILWETHFLYKKLPPRNNDSPVQEKERKTTPWLIAKRCQEAPQLLVILKTLAQRPLVSIVSASREFQPPQN